MQLPGFKVQDVLFKEQDVILLRALKEDTSKSVLIKTSTYDSPSSAVLSRLIHEFEMLKGLKLDGLIKPLKLESANGTKALILEDPGGTTLSTLLDIREIDLPVFFNLAIDLVGILGKLHRKGIVHKDLHSGNIIVSTDVEPIRVSLTGMGIASVLPRENIEKAAPHQLEGTLSVMSPEQTGRMNRPLDFRSDFYSLGVVFYQMLTGVLPFSSDDPLELVHAHLAIDPVSPYELKSYIPHMISRIVMKLLSKDAENRYKSVYGLLSDLEKCKEDFNKDGTIEDFELGSQDVSETFRIPDRLYGRKQEINMLLSAFQRTRNGPVELLLINGFAGIGKTTLVNSLRDQVLQQRGFFIRGNCDPLGQDVPCAPLIEAFSDWADQVLMESETFIEKLRNDLLNVLADKGRILTEVIPDLSLVIGEQPSVPKLPPEQARNRFQLVLQWLVAAATHTGRPLVLFLDDLHWADLSTFKMIENLVIDPELNGILIIAAFRDHDEDETHNLNRKIDEIRSSDGKIEALMFSFVSFSLVWLSLV